MADAPLPSTNDALAILQQYGLNGGQAQGGMGLGGNMLNDSTMVYLGDMGKPAGLQGPFGASAPFSTAYAQAKLAPRDWSATQLKTFVNRGIINKVPGFEAGMGLPEVLDAWDRLITRSFELNQGLPEDAKKWTPMDVLATYSTDKGNFGTKREGDWVYDVATGERIKYVGKTSRTQKSSQVDLSSEEDVQALTTQVLREALGRAPSAKELAQFKSTITGLEKSRPQVTTTTQTITPEMIEEAKVSGADVWSTATSESTTSGGVSDAARAQLVQGDVEDTKEYAKFQSGTTYFNALMAMVGGS
jgi:hypothetical protein